MDPAVACPRCRRELVKGSLRCKTCGADARKARPAGDLSLDFALDVEPLLDEPPKKKR